MFMDVAFQVRDTTMLGSSGRHRTTTRNALAFSLVSLRSGLGIDISLLFVEKVDKIRVVEVSWKYLTQVKSKQVAGIRKTCLQIVGIHARMKRVHVESLCVLQQRQN